MFQQKQGQLFVMVAAVGNETEVPRWGRGVAWRGVAWRGVAGLAGAGIRE